MPRVLEAVPNFSEGRDAVAIAALVETIAAHDVDVLDWSSDPDHHRTVVTYIGPPPDVERAALAAASFALEHFDLRKHRGVHPRTGALDVLPFVPLHGVTMADATASAHRVGGRMAELGIPVFFYGQASKPVGRSLASLRRGGFEALDAHWSATGPPDRPADTPGPHPSAGVSCVGSREILLAWNVYVAGVDVADARRIATLVRERDGGFKGLRALGLRLDGQDRVQVSMNLEDAERANPLEVFDQIEAHVQALGGSVTETEVIGMMPNTLVLPGSADRLKLPDPGSARVLSHRVAEHLAGNRRRHTEIPDTTE